MAGAWCSRDRLYGAEGDVGAFGGLTGAVNAGETLNRAAPSPFVEALGVALYEHLDRGVDGDPRDLAFAQRLLRHSPSGANWRDQGG